MQFVQTIDPCELSVSARDYEKIKVGDVYKFNGQRIKVIKKMMLWVGGPTVRVRRMLKSKRA